MGITLIYNVQNLVGQCPMTDYYICSEVCNLRGLHISFCVESRRRAARQKRKGSAQENGGTVHHEVLADGIRQRKPQQHPNSGLGTLFYCGLNCWMHFVVVVLCGCFMLFFLWSVATMTASILTCTCTVFQISFSSFLSVKDSQWDAYSV